MHTGRMLRCINKDEKVKNMKWIFALLVLAGMVFAGQIVNVGETTEGSSVSPATSTGADDSECYTQYFQCLRIGCAAAGGNFNELTQGCYGGNDAKFSEAVGKCADAQGDCIMGKASASQPAGGSSAAGTSSSTEEGAPLCGIGMALLALGAALIARRS